MPITKKDETNENMVKVSVFMITYNHEKYIRQAIESIINQKVGFSFELVIGEDYSPDGTRAVCEQYAREYPNIVKLIPSTGNVGPMSNTLRTLEACTGTYIAMCEGDDFWVDPNKLQKQADFLDANPDYSMCFSDVETVSEIELTEPIYPEFTKDTYTIEDIILSPVSLIPTPSLMFRNILSKPLPKFFAEALGGDMVIQLLIADKGKAKFMPERMAAYRNHAGGLSKADDIIEKWGSRLVQTFRDANKYFGYRYKAVFKKRFFDMSKGRLIYGARNKKGFGRITHYFTLMPDYIKYSDKINLKEVLYFHLILFAPGFLKRLKRA
jgi:glycosyltransferase involved in cell wall biosynthesis